MTWVTERLTGRATGLDADSTVNPPLPELVEKIVRETSRFGKFRQFEGGIGRRLG